MAAGYVPNGAVTPLYENTTPGTVASPVAVDGAVVAMVQTINDNWQAFYDFIIGPIIGVPDGAVTTPKIRDLAITTQKIAELAVVNSKIADGTISTQKLSDSLITTLKLADASVTNAKLAELSVTVSKIADGTISTQKLMDALITTAKLGNGSVTEPKLSNGSVSTRALADRSVTAGKLEPSLVAPISDAGIQYRFGLVNEQLDDIGKNVRAAGAGSGGDDTAIIQSIMNMKGSIIIPDGEYLVDPLFVKSDTVIIFGANAILKAKDGYGPDDRLLNIISARDITIYGNHATIELKKNEYTSGEQRHGVFIMDSDYVSIYDLHSNDSGGDGFYIGGNVRGYSNNISLNNCYANNNRRQGLSIVTAKNVNVFGGGFTNTTGTSPSAGIDVEPNLSTDFIENINLIGINTSGNDGAGIMVVPGNTHNSVSVNILDCVSTEDCKTILASGGIYVSNSPTKKVRGKITVNNTKVIRSGNSGLGITRWNENAPDLKVRGLYVEDCAGNNSFERFKAGVSLTIEATDVGNWFGNVDLVDCEVIDTRSTPLTYVPYYFYNFGTKEFRNIKLENPKATNWVLNANISKIAFITKTRDCVVKYSEGYDLLDLASRDVSNFYHGSTLCNGILRTSPKYTLPAASTCIGMEIAFRVDVDGATWVQPAATDLIRHYSNGANGGITAWKKGSFIRLKAITDTEWQVIDITGGWAPYPFRESALPTMYEGSAPTTGTWALGSQVNNLAPSRVKNISHWKNVAAGTPGTWMAYGTGWGTTAERPTLVSGDSGYSYFDTTLAKMIIWNGSAWIV